MYLDDEGVKDEEEGIGGAPEHHGGGLTWPHVASEARFGTFRSG